MHICLRTKLSSLISVDTCSKSGTTKSGPGVGVVEVLTLFGVGNRLAADVRRTILRGARLGLPENCSGEDRREIGGGLAACSAAGVAGVCRHGTTANARVLGMVSYVTIHK